MGGSAVASSRAEPTVLWCGVSSGLCRRLSSCSARQRRICSDSPSVSSLPRPQPPLPDPDPELPQTSMAEPLLPPNDAETSAIGTGKTPLNLAEYEVSLLAVLRPPHPP